MVAKKSAGGTPATVALAAAGVAFTLHAYEHHDDARHFGPEAAQALDVDPARIFKTLLADVDGRLVCALIPVSGQLDLKALAAAVGAKRAAMADPRAATRSTGYVVGGISPVGQRTRLQTVVDASALHLPTLYVSAGRRGLQLELTPHALLGITGASTAPIALHPS